MHALIKVKDLKKYFFVRGGILLRTIGTVRAVDGVSFDIKKGETLGLVGESGCGKTTVGRTILLLLKPTAGEIRFEGHVITKLNKHEIKPLRRRMQIVFQDPFGSLNPRMTVSDIIGRPMEIHGLVKQGEKGEKVIELLKLVGLNPDHLYRFPHEFSGGQRQRIAIARALALYPEFLVLDEPTSSLDVSVQAQILNLLKDLQVKFGLTYLFISHNLSMIRHMSDRIAVMYLGKIVEMAEAEDMFREQLHPYTRALFSAIPLPDPKFRRSRIVLKGDVPSPINPPSGCRFHPRCQDAGIQCKEDEPELIDLGNGHHVCCHLF